MQSTTELLEMLASATTALTMLLNSISAPPQNQLPTLTNSTIEKSLTYSNNRYDYPASELEKINTESRDSVVNILCTNSKNKKIHGITGSGVIIDPRGIILTNAHIGQYFLLTKLDETGMKCVIRTGSPARYSYNADLIYLPPTWLKKHAEQIYDNAPTATGEDDYSLLLIKNNTEQAVYPHVDVEIRNFISNVTDKAVVIGYPASFLGSKIIRKGLYKIGAIITIEKLLTFKTGTIDAISLGSTILAQHGASGGAIINQWGKLIGIVVTTTSGDSTSQRNLRGLTTEHINRSMLKNSDISLNDFLHKNTDDMHMSFNKELLEGLLVIFKPFL